MRVQRSRADVLPLTWEVPTALVASWLVLAMLALPAGQGLACSLTGHGFAWPRGALVQSVIGLGGGTPGEGLSGPQAAAVPAAPLVYSVIVLVELVISAAAVIGLLFWWRTVGPGAQFGLATTSRVRDVLGTGNLRRRRSTIRPDQDRSTRQAAGS